MAMPRFILLRKEEDLNAEASTYLSKIRQTFPELTDVPVKEKTSRSIYARFSGRRRIAPMGKGRPANSIRSTAQNGKGHITTLGWNSGIPASRKCGQCHHDGVQQQGADNVSPGI